MTRRAILVEDDPATRKMLRKYLEKLDFAVDEASNGKAALQLFAKGETPALICVDLMLPELSGYDLCERVRADARLGKVPIIVCSGRSLPADRAFAFELGANAYLIKPIRWNSFAQTVRGMTGAPE